MKRVYDFSLLQELDVDIENHDYFGVELKCCKTNITASVDFLASFDVRRDRGDHDSPTTQWIERCTVSLWDWTVWDSEGFEKILTDEENIQFELDAKSFLEEYFLTA